MFSSAFDQSKRRKMVDLNQSNQTLRANLECLADDDFLEPSAAESSEDDNSEAFMFEQDMNVDIEKSEKLLEKSVSSIAEIERLALELRSSEMCSRLPLLTQSVRNLCTSVDDLIRQHSAAVKFLRFAKVCFCCQQLTRNSSVCTKR